MPRNGLISTQIDAVVSTISARRLRAFRAEVERAFPGRLTDVLLFGSRARSEAEPGSDYDVAIVFRGLERTAAMRDALSEIAYPFVRAGMPIRPLAILSSHLTDPDPLPVARNIARDGISIS